MEKNLMINKLVILILFGSLLFICMSSASAATGTIYVNGSSGNDAWDGLTPQSAKLTIKNATKTVKTGGTIFITNGTYSGTGNSNIEIDHDMTIIGAGKNKTIISGLNSNQIFLVDSGVNFYLKSLTITNGKSAFGGGMLNQGYTTIDNCEFTKCTAVYAIYGGGSAICNGNSGTLIVSNTDFLNNNATLSDTGGTIYTNGTLNMTGCNFIGNQAKHGGCVYIFLGKDSFKNCNFINNNASESGGVLEVYKDVNVSMYFCSFINNTATFIPSSSNIDATFQGIFLNVTSNWWGTNDGPYGIRGSYTADDWIYMTLKADPSSIKSGKTSTVTASFNNLYNPTTRDVTGFEPSVNHILDGLIVYFTTDIGLITEQSTVTNGLAAATFKGTQTGTALVQATSANQVLSTTITVGPIGTTVTLDPVLSNFPGQNIDIKAHVSDDNGDPVDGGVVYFTLFGKTYEVTINDGVASLTLTIPSGTSSGNNNILAQYDGTGTIYSNSVTKGSVAVTKVPTVLTVDDVTGNYGDTVTVHARLKDYYQSPLIHENVDFNIDGKTVSGTTDENGDVTVTYIIRENSGSYTVNASFNGDNIFNESNAKGTLTVTRAPVTIKVSDLNGKHWKNVDLTAVLKDKNSNPISGRELIFYIKGTEVGRATTNSSGTAVLTHLIDEFVGSYTLSAALIGDPTYQDASGKGTLTINPINTQIKMDNTTIKNGDKTKLKATLTDENGNPLKGKTITFNIKGLTIGTATTNNTGTANLYYIANISGNFVVNVLFNGDDIYSHSNGNGSLNVNPWANIYIKTTTNNANPKIGDTFTINYKLGNNGPDTANNVVISFKIPVGLEFITGTTDNGQWTYNPLTTTLTWTLKNVVVGDPNLKITLKAITSGNYTIIPTIKAITTTNITNNGTININVLNNTNGTGNNTNHNTKLPNTGLPIAPLIAGLLMVIGGITVKK